MNAFVLLALLSATSTGDGKTPLSASMFFTGTVQSSGTLDVKTTDLGGGDLLVQTEYHTSGGVLAGVTRRTHIVPSGTAYVALWDGLYSPPDDAGRMALLSAGLQHVATASDVNTTPEE